MGQVSKNDQALEAMAQGDPDEPVVMLNLLRYRELAASGAGVDGLSGREAYGVYGKKFAELGPRFGGAPIWMGRALHSLIGAEDWDIVILVRYPTRRQFVEMMADPNYVAIAPIRAAALADSRLLEMSQLLPAMQR
ncbi:MAG: DUF1330 domain-containing protein [Pseudomonadales bacterium]